MMRFLAVLALAWALPGWAHAQAPAGCETTRPGWTCFSGFGSSLNVLGWPASAPALAGAWWTAPNGIPPSQLAAAIAAAKPGDTIALAAGATGLPSTVIRNRTFDPPLTITSADPFHMAEIDGLQVSGVTGLRLVALDIHNTDPLSAQSPALNIQASFNVLVTGSRIRGIRDPLIGLLLGKGIVVTGGSDVTISGNEVLDLFKGVTLADVANPTVTGNDLHNIRTSPIDGGGLLKNVVVTFNHIHGIAPDRTQGDHSDGIHFFTKSGSPVHGLTIRGNRMECPGDCSGTLGINLEGTPAPGGFDGVLIDGNILAWNNNQGITTNWVVGSITNNALSPTVGLDNPAHAPAMVLRNSAVTATGNSWKCGPSAKPFTANTCLTAAQIAQMGAAVAP